jgi:hypothetical protein
MMYEVAIEVFATVDPVKTPNPTVAYGTRRPHGDERTNRFAFV